MDYIKDNETLTKEVPFLDLEDTYEEDDGDDNFIKRINILDMSNYFLYLDVYNDADQMFFIKGTLRFATYEVVCKVRHFLKDTSNKIHKVDVEYRLNAAGDLIYNRYIHEYKDIELYIKRGQARIINDEIVSSDPRIQGILLDVRGCLFY